MNDENKYYQALDDLNKFNCSKINQKKVFS